MKTACSFLLLALAGCQGAVSAGVKPAARPAAASKAPAASNPLARPAGRTDALAGRVVIDPSYVVKQQAGKLMTVGNGGTPITQDGGSVLAAGTTSLIGNDGGSIISNDGGSVVAQGAGNMVAPASLIAQDGGSVIGQGPFPSVISSDAASLVAPAKARRLFAAEDTAPVAAAGMVVYARSLTTHQPLELGQDKDGKPAYAVYTNLKGEYELYLPPGQADNVEVVAFVPGKPDPRMHFQNVLRPGAGDAPVSDDTSIVTNYIRVAFRTFARRLIATDNSEILNDDFVASYPFGQDFIKQRVQETNQKVRANGIDQLPEAERERVVDRLTDIVLAHAGLTEAMPNLDLLFPDNPYPLDRNDPKLTSIAVLRKLLGDQLPDVARLLAEPGTAARFEAAPLVQAANARDHRTYKFQRASDYFDFVALAVIGAHATTDPGTVTQEITTLEEQVGLPKRPGGANWVLASLIGLMNNLGVTLMIGEGVDEQLDALFQSLRKG